VRHRLFPIPYLTLYTPHITPHYTQILEHKLIYLETKDVVETTLALDNYKRACDSGRGAVFLSVARGKVAEGIDFDRHYGRCVVIFGIPYQYTLSHVLRARLNYMREKYNIRDNDFLTFDALRQAAQCVGRVIRSKTDYGIVILADSRYNRTDKRSKFPPWVLQFVKESCLNLPTDSAIDQIKQFLRFMGQPIDQESLHSILLSESQVSGMGYSASNVSGIGGGNIVGGVYGGVSSSVGGKEGREGGVRSSVEVVIDEVVEMSSAVVEDALYNNISNTSNKMSVDSQQSSVDNNVQAYMMDVVSSMEEHLSNGTTTAGNTTTNTTSTTAIDLTGTTNPTTTNSTNNTTNANTSTSAGGNGNKHSKSLFLFEDILDTDNE